MYIFHRFCCWWILLHVTFVAMEEVSLHYGTRKARSAEASEFDETDINSTACYMLIPAYILYILIMLGTDFLIENFLY